MSRYPENPDPDRSGSRSRSRTDMRVNPEPDSGLTKKQWQKQSEKIQDQILWWCYPIYTTLYRFVHSPRRAQRQSKFHPPLYFPSERCTIWVSHTVGRGHAAWPGAGRSPGPRIQRHPKKIYNRFIVMSRYPENPDPDRSESGSRSRTDMRVNPEPDSGLKQKTKNYYFFFFCKNFFLLRRFMT